MTQDKKLNPVFGSPDTGNAALDDIVAKRSCIIEHSPEDLARQADQPPEGWQPLADHPELAEARPMVEGIARRKDRTIVAVFRCFDGNFGWAYGNGNSAAQINCNFCEMVGYGMTREDAVREAEAYQDKQHAKALKRRILRGAKLQATANVGGAK